MTDADAIVRAALAGRPPSDEDLERLTLPDEAVPDVDPDRVCRRVLEMIASHRRRRRIALGSAALTLSAVFTTTLCYKTGFHEGWLGFVGASPVAHEARGMAHGPGPAAPPPAAEAAVPIAVAEAESAAEPPPVVVLVDGAAITEVGWPIPRTLYARLIERLEGAKVIAFDLPFADTDPDWGTGELIAAMRANGKVVLGAWLDTAAAHGRPAALWPDLLLASSKAGGVKGAPRMTRAYLPDSRLVSAAAALGAMNLVDADYLAYRGRRVPTLAQATRAVAGEGAAGRADDRGYAERDVEILTVRDIFAPGGAERVAGRVVYVGFGALAGDEVPRTVQLAMR